MGKKFKSGGGGAAYKKKASVGGKAKSGKRHGAAAASQATGVRKDARKAKRAIAQGRQDRPMHGGAVEETRQRLRAKVIERQLQRGQGSELERYRLACELAKSHALAGRAGNALHAYKQALKLMPDDPEYLARAYLLCHLVDRAQSQEAADLLKGPLFVPLVGQTKEPVGRREREAALQAPQAPLPPFEGPPEARFAATVGRYSLALLTYIAIRVLEEHKASRKDPHAEAKAEARLVARLRSAHKQNPFVAEMLAFAPAFEPYFPVDSDLPPASAVQPEELPMLEALQYCCGLRQLPVWLDTDEEVRKWVRETLFEEEDEVPGAGAKEASEEEPPLARLPTPAPGRPQGQVMSRWRKAREEALELWASEMAEDGQEDSGGEGEGGEEGEESEDDEDEEESEDDEDEEEEEEEEGDSSAEDKVMKKAEARRFR